jgi:hypothetical protein
MSRLLETVPDGEQLAQAGDSSRGLGIGLEVGGKAARGLLVVVLATTGVLYTGEQPRTVKREGVAMVSKTETRARARNRVERV